MRRWASYAAWVFGWGLAFDGVGADVIGVEPTNRSLAKNLQNYQCERTSHRHTLENGQAFSTPW